MFKNYMKLALRNMFKYKAHTTIKIAGFALGLASCIFIYMYVNDELNFDNYHKDIDRIYRVSLNVKTSRSENLVALTQGPLKEELKSKYSQVEESGRIFLREVDPVTYNEKSFYEKKGFAADAGIFQILNIPILQGEVQKSFFRPNTVLISKTFAEKYFGSENPVGKIIKIGNTLGNNNYEVSAVAADAQNNTFFKYNYIISAKTLEDANLISKGWHELSTYTFIKLQPGVDAAAFENQIKDLTHKATGADTKVTGSMWNYFLQPVKDIHLNSRLDAEIESPGNLLVISVLSVFALLILVIASVNYLNLTTALSYRRAKEVSLRKVVGGNTRQLLVQFISESLALTLISLALALIIVILALPAFNSLSGKYFDFSDVFKPSFILIVALGAVITGIISSIYPAIVISLFSPIEGIKSARSSSHSNYLLRKILLTFQFFISFVFIISAFYVLAQVDFMKNFSLGFEKEQKMILTFRDNSLAKDYESIKNEFQSIPGVISTTTSSGGFSEDFNTIAIGHAGATIAEYFGAKIFSFDPDYIPSIKLKLLSGRNFDKGIGSDTNNAVIINRTASRKLGYSKPEDAIFKIVQTTDKRNKVNIIGVIDDFHYQGLQNKIEPLVISFRPKLLQVLTLSFNAKSSSQIVSNVKRIWLNRFPDKHFDFNFLDEQFAALYVSEEKLGGLTSVFACLGLIVSCIGLFGLVAISAQQRKKEIGIRKVLGSSESGIVKLLTSSFLKWVLIGDLIAIPTSYFLIKNWLEEFAYKIELTTLPFLSVTIATVLIALFTLSFQAVKAATANPVDSLRSE